jgi:hypothetical protein
VPLEQILQGHSRARKHAPLQTHPLVVEQVLAIRDQPLERPVPMSSWQIDFKDVSSVPADPDGKRQHVVETQSAHRYRDFRAAGCPCAFGFHGRDRAGSPKPHLAHLRAAQVHHAGSRFPLGWQPKSAVIFQPRGSRFGACLGIEIQVCDPHHPQQNAFVERFHRSYQEECLALDRPATLEQARSVTQSFVQHYNFQRPNQALSCGNRPPRTAFPTLAALPPRPPIVDPDSWLTQLDGLHLERKVDSARYDQHRSQTRLTSPPSS